MAMADMTTPTQPGPYLYFDAIGGEPVPVQLRETESGLGVFFEGREDYDLVADVSGRFEPLQPA
jgi:hypothetical protein